MDNLDDTKKRALHILGNRNFSEQEMRVRLTSKGEPLENVEETVRWLVEVNYINDSRFATQIVKHYSGKGYGLLRIRDELNKRGIPRDLWDEKLSDLNDDEMYDAAYEYLNKKLRGINDKNELRRASDALLRRGFSYDEARTVISRYLESTDTQENPED